MIIDIENLAEEKGQNIAKSILGKYGEDLLIKHNICAIFRGLFTPPHRTIVACGAFSTVIFFAFSIKCFSLTYSTGST